MFGTDAPILVGMVHLAPLPGSPGWDGDLDDVERRALADAETLLANGADALLVENMGDVPYLKGSVPPWTVAVMARITRAVVELGAPTGVQVLAAANREALGVAVASGAHFLRVEAFAYAHVADEGLLEACAGPLLRDRAALGADVQILADVQKKHSAHAITGDLDLEALARGHVFCGADGLVVTGVATGQPTRSADVESARAAGVPVFVGSGVSPDNAAGLARLADGLIVGSWLKEDGDWRRPVDPERVQALKQHMKV